MIKKIYATAWALMTAAAAIWLLTGSFGEKAMVAFSLTALLLLYGFALWTVVVNTSQPLHRSE